MKHHQPIASLSTCPHEVFRDCVAHGVMGRFGKKVSRPRAQLSGDQGRSNAYVLEYEDAAGVTIGRLVRALGRIECWLRPDIATETLIARADAVAEAERVRKVLVAELNAKDQALADARGETIEHFRVQRNYRGMRFDQYRAAQRAGRG